MRLALLLATCVVLWLGFRAIAELRRRFIASVNAAALVNDAPPGPAPRFGRPAGEGLTPVAPGVPVRVVLVDGAGVDTSRKMPQWNALCERGLELSLDVGFPTVSLPVQIALWSGRSQQQTGILFHSGKPVVPPLAAPAIPPQVPGSIAIAESHSYIVHSLGFADTRPPLGKKLPDGWADRWVAEASAAVAGTSPLVFVHILRVDTAGHKFGKRSGSWRTAAETADVILGQLIAAAPGARWFVLADHDHLPGGGHGSEDRHIRIVRACIAGPGVAPGRGGPIHITDLARAIADSLGVTLAADAPGRPLAAALAAPVTDEQVLPTIPPGRAAVAWALVIAGAMAAAWAAWSLRRGGATRAQWLLALPWWWPVAIAALVSFAGTPTLSTPMIYKPKGLDMAQAFAPGLAVLAVALTLSARAGWVRALVGQLALPALGTLAVLVACGGESMLWGGAPCPVVPRWTGWLSPLMLMASAAAAVAALVLLATAVLSSSGPSAPPETRRSEPAGP